MKAYKVFNPDWTCRGFQFEVGKEYKEDVVPELCSKGFHACLKLADCFNYYAFSPENKVAEVMLLGDIDQKEDSDKVCSNHILIVRELSWFEVLEMVNTGVGNTGHRNTGDWNTVSRETGFFNTKRTDFVRVFNKPCPIAVWEEVYKPDFIYFDLTCWVPSSEMTEVEKEHNKDHETTGGYLKKLDYKEAFLASFLKASKKDQAAVRNLPNFDEDVFFEISGIRLSDYGV